MKKTMINFLVIGLSLTYTQGAFAAKSGLKASAEEDMNKTPMPLTNIQKPERQEKKVPSRPKKSPPYRRHCNTVSITPCPQDVQKSIHMAFQKLFLSNAESKIKMRIVNNRLSYVFSETQEIPYPGSFLSSKGAFSLSDLPKK